MERVDKEIIRGNVDAIVLTCINLRDHCSTEIIDTVNEISGGTFELKQPTLYSALKRLQDNKFIRFYEKEVETGGRKRFFNITQKGREYLEARKDEWAFNREVINVIMNADKPEKKEVEVKEPAKEIEIKEVAAAANSKFRVETRVEADEKENKIENDEKIIDVPFNHNVKEKVQAEPTPQILTTYILAETKPEVPEIKEEEKAEVREEIEKAETKAEAEFNKKLESYQAQPNSEKINLLKGVGLEPYIAPTTHVLYRPKQTEPRDNTLKIMPDEKPENYKVKEKAKKHYIPIQTQGFVLINRLRAITVSFNCLLLVLALVLTHIFLKPEYLFGEEIFFIVAYILVAIYLIITLMTFFIFPKQQKLLFTFKTDMLKRLGIAAACIAITVGIYLILSENADWLKHIVYLILPCILSAGVILEGVFNHIAKKFSFFAC
ncbi:MAG: PadR family transcriptional regulator [Christensenellaceae bacterium]|jgi:PadR family transcriptional regulator PadR|nr:PadR family transcriptional regulator [Christensenellaceae bacterium]